jgi:hypothetical protein
MTTPASPYDVRLGQRSGTCSFRLMPTDELVEAPSTLTVTEAATDRALALAYSWSHPEDGPQTGTLLLGVPVEDGVVSAAWVDSWHQRDVVLLTGSSDPATVTVGYEYAPGWSWEIEVGGGDTTTLVMRNAVPERESSPAVTYDVMRASWA